MFEQGHGLCGQGCSKLSQSMEVNEAWRFIYSEWSDNVWESHYKDRLKDLNVLYSPPAQAVDVKYPLENRETATGAISLDC